MGVISKATRGLARAALALVFVACAHGFVAGAPGTVTLALPRPPAHDEAVHLSVKVGRLPANTRVVVRASTGEVVGAISPFGAEARRSGGTYVIAVPADTVKDGKVSVQFEVEERGMAARVPRGDEVQSVTVALAPITPLGTQR